MKFSNFNFFSKTKTETHFKFSTYSKSLEPAANYFGIGRTNRLMIEIDLDDQRNTRLNVSNKKQNTFISNNKITYILHSIFSHNNK